MPAGKRQQSNAMLYSLVIFVGLFIVATALAVIFYVKFEDQSKKAQDAKREREEMVTNGDWRDRGRIVGTVRNRETYFGKMVDYLDRTVSIILGPLGPLGDNSAEVKVDKVKRDVNDILKLAQEHFEQIIDPNVTGLVAVVQNLKASLDRTIDEKTSLEKLLSELRQRFDDAITATQQKEKQLEDEKEQYHQQVVDVTQKYDELKQLMEKTSDERAQTLYAQLEEERNNLKKTGDDLLQTEAELNMTRDRMERALEELRQIKPSPDREVAAYQPDGKAILVDDQAQVVYLNIGTDDHVYPGLTFSIYDRNAPIPRDGKGKAEVEVFSVAKEVSSARIIQSQKTNPIAVNDVAANLVWDSDKTNIFVVAGEFDLNGDGIFDRDAIDKVKELIEKWGGRVANMVSFDTDFLVLGEPPQVPPKPTPEELDLDPMANERYAAAMRRFNLYKEAEDRAKGLWIPVFTYDRFLYLIGFKEQSDKPGVF
jgi:regulator of replication initiation timing